METFFIALRWLHVLAGAVGLVLFWVPVFSRKGSPLHRRFGRWFLGCVNVIGVSSVVSVSSHLAYAHWQGEDISRLPMFGFLMFLGYLGLNVLISAWWLRHVLINKQDLVALRRPLAWALALVALLASIGLLVVAVTVPSPARVIMFALSPIGLVNFWTMRRHLLAPEREARAWFFEHMGHALGLGIAFHAAFFVFGARSVFSQWLVGFWGLLPWLAPVVIGVLANLVWERYYRRQWASVGNR